jgi:hypothetical protein
MARHRKVDVRIWVDEKFRRLKPLEPGGQALWLYLITNPSTTNIPGIYRAGEGSMCDDLQWPLEAFREAFGEVFREGMAEADWKARVIWLPRATRYNQPESPNVVKSWGPTWSEIPECALKEKAFQHLKAFAKAIGEPFLEAFMKACAKPYPDPSPNPEQEQEQEEEKECSEAFRPSPQPSFALHPEGTPEAPILTFPCVRGLRSNGSTWALSGHDLQLLREGFPAVDVLAECKAALVWATANPSKRKTAGGMLAFLSRWMGRVQDRGEGKQNRNGVVEGHQGRQRWTGTP